MTVIGVVCDYDKSFQTFETCIACHESFAKRNCHAPVQIIKLMRDNKKKRHNAGWSATTLTGCPRETALLEVYDYYEPLKEGYNKGRGEWWHHMLATNVDPAPGLIVERRIYREVDVSGTKVRLTGQPDEVYTHQGVLIDGKSKEKLPKKPDPAHEFQFNIYVWLLADGTFLDTQERVQVSIKRGGMHYMTWRTKEDQQWLKMMYPVWDLENTEALIMRRLRPLVQWEQTRTLPRCDPYVKGPWDCGCVKIEKQLSARGIDVIEQH